ncbi:MAG: Veg family protein [Actinobacteria bacterium]|nr:Veg family protein [Actinomycetota bacterium]
MEHAEVEAYQAILKIRSTLSSLVGSKFKFKTNLGRCRVHEAEGYIKEVYPHLFVVYYEDTPDGKCVSYTYTDVLTKTVEIFHCETGCHLFPWIN